MLNSIEKGVIRPEVKEILDRVIEIRRDIHRHPELGLDCVRTGALAAKTLREFGCDIVQEGFAKTGVVAIIKGNLPDNGKTVGLRADMDALPLTEKSGVAWCSEIPAMMHGCGHDGHVAIALAVAYALARSRNFPGKAAIVIQPGEEGFAGAREMIADGLFDQFPMNEIYATHCAANVPLGMVSTKTGPMTAAADLFRIQVKGKGGHGARPHNCVDPVVIAAELISAMQTIASRSVDPVHPLVLTIASVHAGSEDGVSVVPDCVRLAGTTRCMYPQDRDMIERRMGEICDGLSAMYNAQIHLEYVRMYPSLHNHEAQTTAVRSVATQYVGEENVETCPMAMGAEDFSFMLEKVPGNYFRVGINDEDHQALQHNPGFDFNDKCIGMAATILSRLIEERLHTLSK